MATAVIAAIAWGCGRSSLEPGLGPLDAAAPADHAPDLPQDAAGPDGGGGAAGMDAALPAPLCPSVAGADPTQAVLALLSGSELYLYRADGARVAVGRFPGTIWRQGDFVVAVWHAGGQLWIALVDRQGTVRWRYATSPDDQIDPGEVWLDDRGAAAVLLPIDGPGRWGVAIAPDGTPTDLAMEPLGPPDGDGWIPVATGPGMCPCGFARPETGELQLASATLVRPTYAPLVAGGRLFYFGLDAGDPALVMAEPGGVQTFPLPFVDPTATTVRPTDQGAIVLEQAMPRAFLLPDPWRIVEVGPLPSAPNDTLVWSDGDFGLVAVGPVPRWRLGLRTGDVWPIPPPPASTALVQVNGTWALGGGLWRLDLSTGDLVSDDLTGLAPLRPFGNACRSSAGLLLEDGRLALTMIEGDAPVGVYVGQLGHAPWTRIGRPVGRVISLAALRFGDTWVLDADSGKDSFCPPIGSSNPDAGAAPLLGDSVQIVTPGALEPVVFQDHRATEFVFHDTGLCGVERGVAHDFVTGARTELPPVDQDSYYGAQVFWW